MRNESLANDENFKSFLSPEARTQFLEESLEEALAAKENLTTSNESLKIGIEAERQRAEDASTRWYEEREKNRALRDELETKGIDLNLASTRIGLLETTVAQQSRQIKALEAKVEFERTRNSKLQTKLDGTRQLHQVEIERSKIAESRVVKAEARSQQLVEQNRQLREANTSLEENNRNLQAESADKTQALAQTQQEAEKNQVLHAEVIGIKKALDQAITEMERVKGENSGLAGQNKYLVSESNRLKSELGSLDIIRHGTWPAIIKGLKKLKPFANLFQKNYQNIREERDRRKKK